MQSTDEARAGQGLLLVLLLCNAVLLVTRLDRQSLWLDEYTSIQIATGNFAEAKRFFFQFPEQHPLYYVLLKGWMSLFGRSVAALRSLSALFAFATVPLGWLVARRLFDARTALITAALLSFSPFLLYYGQEGRMYTMVCALTLVNTLALLSWLERPGSGTAAWYCITGILAAYTHLFSIFVFPAQLIFVALDAEYRRSRLLRLFGLMCIVGLAYVPWGLVIVTHPPSGQSWKGWRNVVFGLPYTAIRFAVGYSILLANGAWKSHVVQAIRAHAIVLGLALISLLPVVVAGARASLRSRSGRLVLALAAAPACLALLASAAVILIGERYLIVSFPFCAMLLALGYVALAAGRGRWLAYAAGMGYALVTVVALVRYYTAADFGKEQWKDVAGRLTAEATATDGIVVHEGFLIGVLDYYLPEALRARVYEGDDARPADLRKFDRVWLLLAHADDTLAYMGRVRDSFTVVSDTLYPLDSGIRMMLLEPRPGSP